MWTMNNNSQLLLYVARKKTGWVVSILQNLLESIIVQKFPGKVSTVQSENSWTSADFRTFWVKSNWNRTEQNFSSLEVSKPVSSFF